MFFRNPENITKNVQVRGDNHLKSKFLYHSEVQDENLLLIVVFDFLDAQKTPAEKVATN